MNPFANGNLGRALDDAAPVATLDRRHFLKSGAAAGFVLALQLPLGKKALAAETASADFVPNAFVSIAPDSSVTFAIKHHEMGQGATTGLATILAEELDADWSLVKTEYAPANPDVYKNLLFGAQGTGGSSSIANSWMQMRRAGATARAMLMAAAARRWKVPAEKITVSQGVVTGPGGQRASFGELAEAASKLRVPAQVSLKDPKNFVLVGKRDTRRLDSVAKSTGTAMYTIDVKLPGLLTAVIARPPAFGAKLKSFDDAKARAVAGVKFVVEVPEGVAVVATGMWPALEGRKALVMDWDLSAAGPKSTEAMLEDYRKLAAGSGGAPVAQSDGFDAAMSGAARTLEATYEFPYLAHAAMEPMNCVAWLHDGGVETWSGHQFQSFDLPAAAGAAGVPVTKTKLNSLISGGSFGRRANNWSDFTTEAVHVAKAISTLPGGQVPVRVQQTREDDMQGGLYRPLYVHSVKVGAKGDGSVAAWQHRVVGQSIMAPTVMAASIKDGVDETSVEGVWPTPYALPSVDVVLHSPTQPIRPLWWRSVGHTHTAFVMETMMDELATAAGTDPVEYRLALLADQPRVAGVLKLAAEKSGWGKPVGAGRARGIAVHHSFSSYVGQVVEVSLTAEGQPKVERVVVAVDCGLAVNPDVIAAQMEGCVGFALAAALYGEVGVADGVAQQSNFHQYRVLRINEMPVVETHIVESQEAPTGVGEPGVPPLAPAVANALAKLTGQRVRRLPFSRHQFTAV